MTDEEIIKLAEKTKKEKFCIKFNNCWGCPLFKQYGQSSECIDSKYRGSFYTKFFIDGFKAATEYINQIPHFPLKNDSDIERIEKFRDNPELCQTYLRELRDNIECVINGIIAREK